MEQIEKKVFDFTTLIMVILVIGITPLIFHSTMPQGYSAPKEIFLQLIIITAALIQLLRIAYTNSITLNLNALDILIFAKLILIISLVIILDRYSISSAKLDVLISGTLFYWLVQTCFPSYRSFNKSIKYLKYILWIVLIACIIESIIGYLQYFNIIPFQGNYIFESVIIGTFGNVNRVGGFLAASLPLLTGLFLLSEKKQHRLGIGISIFIVFSLIILTESRGAWIGLITAIIIYDTGYLKKIWIYFKKSNFKIILSSVSLGIFTTFVYLLYSMNVASSLGRIFIWKVTSHMIIDNPVFGIGHGNYPVKYLDYQANFFTNISNTVYFDFAANLKQAHNQYLEILAETGVVGLLLFFVLIYVVYRLCSKLINRACNEPLSHIGRMLRASTTVIIVHSFFDSPLFTLPILLLFYFNISILATFLKNNNVHQSLFHVSFSILKKSHMKQLYKLAFVGSCLIGVLLFFNINKKIQGYSLWNDGKHMDYVGSDQWEKSIKCFTKAIQCIPNNGELYHNLGIAYVMDQQFEKALSAFETARINFNDRDIYLFNGIAYQELENYTQAEYYYLKAINMFPNQLRPRLMLGIMFKETNQLQKAQIFLEGIINIKPKIQNRETEIIKNAAAKLLESLIT